jgi:hypothetical protein
VELRRGRPLALEAASYGQLSQLWAGAAFDYDAYTLRHCRALLPAEGPQDEAASDED